MLAAATAGASHPAVAVLLGLGASGLASGVVAMAWNVHVRQIRLAGQLARRQFLVTGEAAGAAERELASVMNGNGHSEVVPEEVRGHGKTAPVVIEGPDTVVTGEQARYRVRPANGRTVVSWAVGGGSVSQTPDPTHPDELLLVADRPGSLTTIVRVREGMAERRATKPITAVEEVKPPAPPITLRLFLHGWGLVAVAILITGFAGALVALGSIASSDFIALVAPLAALLGMVAVVRNTGEPAGRPGGGKGTAGSGS